MISIDFKQRIEKKKKEKKEKKNSTPECFTKTCPDFRVM